jgi:hypothetical protein
MDRLFVFNDIRELRGSFSETKGLWEGWELASWHGRRSEMLFRTMGVLIHRSIVRQQG